MEAEKRKEIMKEIVFVDVETTVPWRQGQGYSLLEFGAILVCPRKLVEMSAYSTLIRPSDLSAVSSASVRCNGITRDSLLSAPPFSDIADTVYDILHGRIWVGHNIERFDCLRIREAFAQIGQPAPEPLGTIDSLTWLKQRFGKRAGDMKLATLANYFGLGQQKHRSLNDVRMNFEVIKYCATVLFLESCLPEMLIPEEWASPDTTIAKDNRGKAVQEASLLPNITTVLPSRQKGESPVDGETSGEACNAAQVVARVPTAEPFNLMPLMDSWNIDSFVPNPNLDGRSSMDALMDERREPDVPEIVVAQDVASKSCGSHAGFLEPDKVTISCICMSVTPTYHRASRAFLMHKGVLLQLCSMKMKIRFGLSTKFLDHAGRPRLSFVVDPSPSLCEILDACDRLVQQQIVSSGSDSALRPVVVRKMGYPNSSTIRLHIPTVANGETGTYSSEIYQVEPSGNLQKLVFSKVDATELDVLLTPGSYVDAYFSLDVYDYQQFTGIRLVAKRLVVRSF